MSDANVTVRLPRVLAELAGCDLHVQVAGDTLGRALDDLLRRRPALALHLRDESGALRRHVLCFCNDRFTRSDLAQPLRPGDTITVLHSVSGGGGRR